MNEKPLLFFPRPAPGTTLADGSRDGPDDRDGLALLTHDPVPDHDRIILADDLAEIPRRREVMVQPAVRDEEDLSLSWTWGSRSFGNLIYAPTSRNS